MAADVGDEETLVFRVDAVEPEIDAQLRLDLLFVLIRGVVMQVDEVVPSSTSET